MVVCATTSSIMALSSSSVSWTTLVAIAFSSARGIASEHYTLLLTVVELLAGTNRRRSDAIDLLTKIMKIYSEEMQWAR
jgi:hypothetical protein